MATHSLTSLFHPLQVNFGWIFSKPTEATVALWQLAYDTYVKHNEWDVRRFQVFLSLPLPSQTDLPFPRPATPTVQRRQDECARVARRAWRRALVV